VCHIASVCKVLQLALAALKVGRPPAVEVPELLSQLLLRVPTVLKDLLLGRLWPPAVEVPQLGAVVLASFVGKLLRRMMVPLCLGNQKIVQVPLGLAVPLALGSQWPLGQEAAREAHPVQ
jgi:hypothetical protein